MSKSTDKAGLEAGRRRAVSTAARLDPRHEDASGPERLIEIGWAFWQSKALLSAVELDLFSLLAAEPLYLEELVARLGLAGRGARDFFDALVSLEVLQRDTAGRYANSPEAARYVDRSSSDYIGGALQRLNADGFSPWGALTQALRTGKPQDTRLGRGFEHLYEDDDARAQFLNGMLGGVLFPARALAEKFPWKKYRTIIDIGAAQGCCLVQIALRHRHIRGHGLDLPPVGPFFDAYVRANDLSDRLTFLPADFFADPLPKGDVLIFGRVLHNWNLEAKLLLLRNAYAALPRGGALIIYETLIDNARRCHTHALLQSVNMLIMTESGFDYTAAECFGWLEEAGFRHSRAEALACQHTMIVATK